MLGAADMAREKGLLVLGWHSEMEGKGPECGPAFWLPSSGKSGSGSKLQAMGRHRLTLNPPS